MDQNNFYNKKISVVVPIFNEPDIEKNLKTIDDELKKSFSNYEIICVNDGSRDGTLDKLKRCRFRHLKIITYPKNTGKGFALCVGFFHSGGEIIAFIDADLELHPRQLRIFSDLMALTNSDIVIGSKRHLHSQVEYSTLRKIYSLSYQLIIATLFGLNVTDTQVGIKLFKRKVLSRVVPRIAVKTWAFDLEVLIVAYHLGYQKIIEAPVEIKRRKFGSKVDWKTVFNIMRETLAIFYRRNVLKYYDRRLTRADYQRYYDLPE